MRDLAIMFAVAGVLTGLIAVWYLYKSSSQDLDYDAVVKSGTIAPPGISQDDLDDVRIMGAHARYMLLSAKKAKTAARWTAASVVLNGLSAAIGFLQ